MEDLWSKPETVLWSEGQFVCLKCFSENTVDVLEQGGWIIHWDSMPGPISYLSSLTLRQPRALHPRKQLSYKDITSDTTCHTSPYQVTLIRRKNPAKLLAMQGPGQQKDSFWTPSFTLHQTGMLSQEAVLREPSRLSGCYAPKPTAHPSNSKNWKKKKMIVSMLCVSTMVSSFQDSNPSSHQILLTSTQPQGPKMESNRNSLLDA